MSRTDARAHTGREVLHGILLRNELHLALMFRVVRAAGVRGVIQIPQRLPGLGCSTPRTPAGTLADRAATSTPRRGAAGEVEPKTGVVVVIGVGEGPAARPGPVRLLERDGIALGCGRSRVGEVGSNLVILRGTLGAGPSHSRAVHDD